MVDTKYDVHRSNLHGVREQITKHFGDVNERLDVIENYIGTVPAGGIILNYLFNIALSGDPTDGHVGVNNVLHSVVTELRISDLTEAGNDASVIIQSLQEEDLLGIFENVAPNATSFYKVTGDPVDNGTYFTIPVEPSTVGGQSLPTVDDSPIGMYFVGNPNRYLPDGGLTNQILRKISDDNYDVEWHTMRHVDLAEISPNQHHNKAHQHNGLDGSGLVKHLDTQGKTPDDHHEQFHPLYGNDGDGINQHDDVDIALALAERHVLAWNDANKFNPEFRMNWRYIWTQQEYHIHDVVLDSPYTMVANKTTSDRASPVPIGESYWGLPDDPAWITLSQPALVGAGHVYTFTETLYLNSVRVWIPVVGAGIIYRLQLLSDGVYQTKLLPDVLANKWNVVAVDPVLVGAGKVILFYLESQNSGSDTIVTGGWTRGTNSNDAEPANQNWNINNARTVLRIDFDDLNAVDRQSELEGIITGSEIRMVETAATQNSLTFQVLAPPLTRITCVEYQVATVSEGTQPPTIGETTTMTADVPVPQSTDYVGIPLGWGTAGQPDYATVESYLAFNGVNQGADPDNQYGIDINVQRLTISPDWDVLALSGGGGGGGGESSPFPEAPADGQTYGRKGQTFEWLPVYTQEEIDGLWTVNGDDIYNGNIGNVGIAETVPLARLHVKQVDAEAQYGLAVVTDNTDLTLAAENYFNAIIGNDAGYGSLQLLRGLNASFDLTFGTVANPWLGGVTSMAADDLVFPSYIWHWAALGSGFRFTVDGGLEPDLILHHSHNIGMGITDPQFKLDIDGETNLPVDKFYNVDGVPHSHGWTISQGNYTPIWGEKVRFDTPPNICFMPDADQPVTGEQTKQILIWNDGVTPNELVEVRPFSGRRFIVDGIDRGVNVPINLVAGEIVRISTNALNYSYGVAIEAAGRFGGDGTFGFVANNTGESGRFLADTGEWVSAETIPAGGIQFEYIWDTAITNTPIAGHARMNNIDPSLATQLYLSDHTINANDITLFLQNLKTGDFIAFLDKIGGGTYYFKCVDAGIEALGVFTFDVTFYLSDGTIPDAADINLGLIGNPENRLPSGGDEFDYLEKASDSVDYSTRWTTPDWVKQSTVPQDGWLYGQYWDGAAWQWGTSDVGFAGSLGIGTASDFVGKLNVVVDGATLPMAYITRYHNAATGVNLRFRKARGTALLPLPVIANDQLMQIHAIGYGDTNFFTGAGIRAYADENFSDIASGSRLGFWTTPLGSTSVAERMRIAPSGNIGINNDTPESKLHVQTKDDTISAIFADNAVTPQSPIAGSYWSVLMGNSQVGGYGAVGLLRDDDSNFDMVFTSKDESWWGGFSEYGNLQAEPLKNSLQMWHNKLSFFTGGAVRMVVAADGNVGIGESFHDPIAPLHVSTDNWRTIFNRAHPTGAMNVIGSRSRGTVAAPTTIVSGDSITNFAAYAQKATVYTIIGQMRFLSPTVSGDAASGEWRLSLNDAAGTLQDRMTVDEEGHVGINVSVPIAGGGLHILTLGAVQGTYPAQAAPLVIEGDSGAAVQFLSPSGTNQNLVFGDEVRQNEGRIRYDHTNNHLLFRAGGIDNVVFGASNVGIGYTTEPPFKLDIAGETRIASNNGLRHTANDQSWFWRLDSSNYYLMQTAEGDPDGSWNALRTIVINNDTGHVAFGTSSVSGTYRMTVAGSINITAGQNYYINGVPISSFVDAPIDGSIYGRQDAAWVEIDAGGGGTISNLSLSRDSVQNIVLNSGGDNVTLLAASTSLAGVMTASDKSKLDGIANNANKYVHPSYNGDDMSVDTGALSGATVISDLDFNLISDTEGHVVDANATINTRNLTAADVGAMPEGAVPVINSFTVTLNISGVSDSGTVVVTLVGNWIYVSGRRTWSTAGSGTSHVTISGLPHPAWFNCGGLLGTKNVKNTSTDGMGIGWRLNAGSTTMTLTAPNAQGDNAGVDYNHMEANGEINFAFGYVGNFTP